MSDVTRNQTITPAQHLAEVLAAYDDSPNPRLAEITKAFISHIHQFVAEVGLTREKWFAGIEALTRTGHMCSDERQEFILLSDTIGVSMLVEMINHAGAEGTTEPTVFGPFHVDGAPAKAMGDSIVVDIRDTDQPVVFSGQIRSLDGTPIERAELDVWETASNGLYDVQDPEQSTMNMRGVFTTGADGRYQFTGVRPVDSDAVFGVRPSLVVDMTGATCQYDFVLEPVG